IKNEFIKFNGKLEIPKIPVKELSYDKALAIIKSIAKYIPEFLYDHELLIKRKPASEQHSLQFIKEIKGRVLDFIHIFKIYLKFEGDSKNIIEKGDTENYPSYTTDRFYYKSRIIPVTSVSREKSDINFQSIKLIDADYVNYIEGDNELFTAAVFFFFYKNGITKDINHKLNLDIYNISTDVYPFIVFDYFTACFNVLYPDHKAIDRSIEVFEPLFIILFNKYNDLDKIGNIDEIEEHFEESMYISDVTELKLQFISTLKSYFKQWSVYRDDDLLLKGWWRIIME
ncbi:MAG: hypothetical protein GY834_12890, partial [Bacteroidetes bacterium]|nr:hypothetical protein [Bacteroidota bacterium]